MMDRKKLDRTLAEGRRILAVTRGAVGAGVDWWVKELVQLLPRRAAELLSGSARIAVIPLGAVRPAEAEPPRGGAVLILLDAAHLLIDRFRVPAANPARMRQMMGFEATRRTPYRAEDILFDFAVVETGSGDAGMLVELAVAPLTLVQQAQAAGAGLGYGTVAVGAFADERGEPRYAFAKTRQRRVFRLRRPEAVLAGALVLLSCSLGYVVYDHFATARDLARQVAAIKAEAGAVQKRKAQIDALSHASAFLADRNRRPKILGILREVTHALPDDTSLSEFSLAGSELRLVGSSAAAAGLIERLATVEGFEKPRFRAPITPEGDKGTEHFDISVTVRGR